MPSIGKRATLAIVRESAPGLYLNGEELGEILLPRRYIPRNVAPKDKLDVFIYRDSEDRLVATTETPVATVGEFALFRVLSVNRAIGAFLDWGLSKDLLLPFREQERPVRPGQRVVACVYLDPQTQRVVASTRLHRHLSKEPPEYLPRQPVQMLITGASPLGYTAIVENSHQGLLYRDNLSAPLQIGDKLNGFIRAIRLGGKIDLTLDLSGYKRVAPLKDQIIEALQNRGGSLPLDDDTSPEEIRKTFHVSKKAFKQALGALYKSRRIQFLNPGIQLLDNSSWKPGDRNA